MKNKEFLGWAINGDFTAAEADALQNSADIVEEVMYERREQYRKFGDQSNRSMHEYLSILVEEIGEVAKEINDITYGVDANSEEWLCERLEALRVELIQTAAVTVGSVEVVDKLLARCAK